MGRVTENPSGTPRAADLRSGEWLDANRAHWDERVPIHVASAFYDQAPLRAGVGRLTRVDEAELARLFPAADGRFDLSGKRVLHLQCHFGADTLTLAQRGASVVGLDFSMAAIRQARQLAGELQLSGQARFIASNLYDARHTLPEPESFDVIFTTWGTICWLPDIAEWARIAEWFLKPGGILYFADSHPAAQVFEADPEHPDALPVFRYPHGDDTPDVYDEDSDYADENAVLQNTRGWEWAHPLSHTIGALLAAGLSLDRLVEHDEVPWRMYPHLVPTGDGMYGWPAEKWLPLAVSLVASKPRSAAA